MNPHDKAHELVKAIKGSSQYDEFKKIKVQVEAREEYKKMLDDFRERQFEVQKAQITGESLEEEKVKALEHLHQLMVANPSIREYLEAEYRFVQLISDIQKIIGEGLEL